MTDHLQTADVARVADAAARGELIREGERAGLRYVRRYPHPAERVWRAITESDQLRYWMPCDIVGERRRAPRSRCRSGPGTWRSTPSTSRP